MIMGLVESYIIQYGFSLEVLSRNHIMGLVNGHKLLLSVISTVIFHESLMWSGNQSKLFSSCITTVWLVPISYKSREKFYIVVDQSFEKESMNEW